MNAKKAQIVAMAVAGGFAFGVMISIGLHLLDSSLRSVEQTERVTGLSVLGAIPSRPKFDFSRAGAVLVEEPDSIIAEAIRSLRTSLYLAGRKAWAENVPLYQRTCFGRENVLCDQLRGFSRPTGVGDASRGR